MLILFKYLVLSGWRELRLGVPCRLHKMFGVLHPETPWVGCPVEDIKELFVAATFISSNKSVELLSTPPFISSKLAASKCEREKGWPDAQGFGLS